MSFLTVTAFFGLIAQLLIFILFASVTYRARALIEAVVFGLILALFGYSLVLTSLMFFGVHWALINLLLVCILPLLFIRVATRRAVADFLAELKFAVRRHSHLVVIAAGLLLYLVLSSLLSPEFSVDGQLYHGPVLAHLGSTGSLWGWTVLNEYQWYTSLGMVSGLNLAFTTPGVLFDDAIQIPYFFMLFLATVWGLRKATPHVGLRFSIALLLVSAPVVWFQAKIMYVDLVYGAGILVAILLLSGVDRFRKTEFLVIGVALGGVMATKPAGLLASVALGCFLLVRLLVESIKDRQELRVNVVRFLGITVPSAFLGFSFYARNWLSFDNPMFPVAVSVGPVHFPGIVNLDVFASGERGDGVFDLGRLATFFQGIIQSVVSGPTRQMSDHRDTGIFGFSLTVLFGVLVVFAVVLLINQIARKGKFGLAGYSLGRFVGVSLLASALVLSLQPSTFDPRYVIGPVFALAILLFTLLRIPQDWKKFANVTAASLIVFSLLYIAWTDWRGNPGIKTVADLRTLPASDQPLTPGNLWSRSDKLLWLPKTNAECFTIAIETKGGVSEGGMQERSLLGSLSYGLYGESLCNRVESVSPDTSVSSDSISAIQVTRDGTSLHWFDYFVVYSENTEERLSQLNVSHICWVEEAVIPADGRWSQGVTVLRNLCAR